MRIDETRDPCALHARANPYTQGQAQRIGLAIARENARLHGGDLTAANRSPGGAVFALHLPRPGGGPGDPQ